MKIDPRVSELADPEIWHFPLTLLVVLTTLSHYRVRCDGDENHDVGDEVQNSTVDMRLSWVLGNNVVKVCNLTVFKKYWSFAH